MGVYLFERDRAVRPQVLINHFHRERKPFEEKKDEKVYLIEFNDGNKKDLLKAFKETNSKPYQTTKVDLDLRYLTEFKNTSHHRMIFRSFKFTCSKSTIETLESGETCSKLTIKTQESRY